MKADSVYPFCSMATIEAGRHSRVVRMSRFDLRQNREMAVSKRTALGTGFGVITGLSSSRLCSRTTFRKASRSEV